MGRRLHSTDARRYVRMAQFSGVALGVSAAALLALDVPGLGYSEPARPQVPAAEVPKSLVRVDSHLEREGTAAAAVRFDSTVSRPVAQKPVEKPKEPEIKQEPQVGLSIAYIGPIYEPTRMVAVLAIEGRQQIVPEGRSLGGGARLVSIADDKIELETESGRKTIVRGERTGTAVSWVRSTPGAAVAAQTGGANQTAVRRAGVQGGRQQAGNNLSPEMQARFREAGIDQAQAQRWREAARQRNQGTEGMSQQALDARVQARMMAEDSANVPRDADFEEYVTETVTEDGEVVITRLRRMHESGAMNEDEYMDRMRRLREEGRIDELEKLP